MAAFEYVALDVGGKSVKGLMDGDSPRQIRSMLRNQGLHPMQIQKIQNVESAVSRRFFKQRISAAGLALLTRQLATMARAGIPLEECLRALGDQVGSAGLRSVVAGVRADITDGATLHDALGHYPHIFPELYRVMVEAGESGGRLDEVLDRLADYTEERQSLRQKLSVALIYPCLVSIVALLVVIALLTYVVPEVVRVFEQTGQTLPFLTIALIATSEFVRHYGIYLFISSVAAIFLIRLSLKQKFIRWYWDRILLSFPVLGKFIRSLNTARLTRTLFILTESGVPLLDALSISARMVKNGPLHEAVKAASVEVREGGRLHKALKKSDYFPPLLIHMLAAGEDSGELENMLEKAAVNQERELETTMTAATSLLEPLMILFMGCVVLIIVLAILLPIFEMNQLVGS